MGFRTTALIAVIKTLNLLLGGLITLYAYRAYRRTGSPALLSLALGVGTITLGAALAGVVDQLLPLGPGSALLVESLFATAGLGMILYSVYR